MPGPVSDSYDPEWSTGANADEITSELNAVYGIVSAILGNTAPLYILDLTRAELSTPITATLTEKQWRIIRFALERADESV